MIVLPLVLLAGAVNAAAEVLTSPASITASLAVIGGAFALGLRHGIDWDHIAAITDITSTTVGADVSEKRLTREPGLMLTDESHHATPAATAEAVHAHGGSAHLHVPMTTFRFATEHRAPLFLATLYALGHGTMVAVLGLIALLLAGFLPDWIDPIVGRIVGVTLLFLALYLFYSIYRYFHGGEFRLRSRWMLVFQGVRNGYAWLQAKLHGHEYHRIAHAQKYGARTAYGIGLIHGVGAETGTQVLVIATAVGADSKVAGVSGLAAFIVGLLISNSIVTVATSVGFVSAHRRQSLYVGAGALAATFSLVLGLMFTLGGDAALPDLDPYFRWISGPA